MSSHSSSVKSPWVDLQVVDMEPSAFPISQAYGIWQPDGWQLCHSSGYIFTTASKLYRTKAEGTPMATTLSRSDTYATVAQRAAAGKAARSVCPRSSHAEWSSDVRTIDPLTLLAEQAMTRVPELVPIRYGRMAASPFAYFRGPPTSPTSAASPPLSAISCSTSTTSTRPTPGRS